MVVVDKSGSMNYRATALDLTAFEHAFSAGLAHFNRTPAHESRASRCSTASTFGPSRTASSRAHTRSANSTSSRREPRTFAKPSRTRHCRSARAARTTLPDTCCCSRTGVRRWPIATRPNRFFGPQRKLACRPAATRRSPSRCSRSATPNSTFSIGSRGCVEATSGRSRQPRPRPLLCRPGRTPFRLASRVPSPSKPRLLGWRTACAASTKRWWRWNRSPRTSSGASTSRRAPRPQSSFGRRSGRRTS